MNIARDISAIYRRSGNVDETRIGDRIVLYHRDSGNGIVLNPSGTIIWDTLVSPKSAAELGEKLLSRFAGADIARVTDDVDSYLASLMSQGLLIAEE